ncbi:MAG: hypothetical protein ACC682_07020 [Gemmatimonadota bacterium]
MSGETADFERFTGFLLRAAASYHTPPETPRDDIWARVELAVGFAGPDGAATADASLPGLAVGSDDDLVDAAAGYHAPSVTPHDDMWARIEPAWELRRSAPAGAREAGLADLTDLDPLPETFRANRHGPDRRRTVARWAAPIGIAASLVIGIALGRTFLAPGEPSPAVAIADQADGSGSTVASEPVGEDAPSRRDVAVRLATARHLGQAESLLTSFRTDEAETGSGGTLEMSGWARELLGETRLLLDLRVERTPREAELLEELELVLAQIARLGPDAPAFEREIVIDGLVRQGTIARLRAASPPGAGTSIGM